MKVLTSLFFLFMALTGSSQFVEISNASKLPPKSGKFKVVGKNNDGIIVRLYGIEDVINVYGDDLKLLTTKTISFKNQSGQLQHIMLNKNGAVIFYLEQDKRRSLLYAQPVNSKFMEIGQAVLVDSIADRKEMVASNLRFKQSVDQSSLLIYYPVFSMNKVESIRFLCVDRSLKVLYNKTVPVNRDEKELEESKSLVDNAGNAFLILKPDVEAGGQYDVLHFDTNGDFSTYSLKTERTLFGEPAFEIDNKNGNLVMTTFYDAKKSEAEAAANGFLYASFDPANGTPVKTNYTPFSREFIAELTGRENVTNQSLYTFTIRKSMLRNDGGSLIIAESYIKETRDQVMPTGIQPGYNGYRSSDIFQFNDIIAFSLNPDGKMEWSSVMRKKQVSEDDNGTFSSFLIMNEKEKLRFIYLDDIAGSGTLNEYVLSSMGKYDRDALLNQEEKDVMIIPKMGKQVSPNEVILPSFRSNTLRLVKISF